MSHKSHRDTLANSCGDAAVSAITSGRSFPTGRWADGVGKRTFAGPPQVRADKSPDSPDERMPAREVFETAIASVEGKHEPLTQNGSRSPPSTLAILGSAGIGGGGGSAGIGGNTGICCGGAMGSAGNSGGGAMGSSGKDGACTGGATGTAAGI